MAKKRIGRQEPTQSIILPFKNSLYKEAVSLYEKTDRKAFQWQQVLLKSIFAQNSDGLWTHTKFGYSLPRRNGKNEIAAIREMWGLQQSERILHTAHRTTTSRAAWERLMSLLDKAGIPYKSIGAIGRERIDTANGGRVDFRTRSSKGGLGEGFDLLVIDEAQEYTDDQESALKYVVTDSQNPQTLFCGTPPTPLSSGTVFMDLRTAAFEGASPNTGWAEWSVEEESDPHDRDLWYLTNPSLGLIFTERSVADEIGPDAIDFNIQRLGLWLRYNQTSAISAGEWEDLRVGSVPALAGRLFVGVKFGADGTNVAMSIAVKTMRGKVFVEAIDCQPVRNGTGWIVAFLKKADFQAVVIDGANGQKFLETEMKENRIRPSPVLPTVNEIIVANSAFEQAVQAQQSLCHMGQPSLAEVIANCEKRPIGSRGGFGYRAQIEGHEIALLDSVMLAHWVCAESKPRKKQRIGY